MFYIVTPTNEVIGECDLLLSAQDFAHTMAYILEMPLGVTEYKPQDGYSIGYIYNTYPTETLKKGKVCGWFCGTYHKDCFVIEESAEWPKGMQSHAVAYLPLQQFKAYLKEVIAEFGGCGKFDHFGVYSEGTYTVYPETLIIDDVEYNHMYRVNSGWVYKES